MVRCYRFGWRLAFSLQGCGVSVGGLVWVAIYLIAYRLPIVWQGLAVWLVKLGLIVWLIVCRLFADILGLLVDPVWVMVRSPTFTFGSRIFA